MYTHTHTHILFSSVLMWLIICVCLDNTHKNKCCFCPANENVQYGMIYFRRFYYVFTVVLFWDLCLYAHTDTHSPSGSSHGKQSDYSVLLLLKTHFVVLFVQRNHHLFTHSLFVHLKLWTLVLNLLVVTSLFDQILIPIFNSEFPSWVHASEVQVKSVSGFLQLFFLSNLIAVIYCISPFSCMK